MNETILKERADPGQVDPLPLSQLADPLKLRLMVDAAVAVVVLDVARRIVEVNPRFCRISGFASEELIGREYGQVNATRFSPDFDQVWTRVLSGETHDGEFENTNKAGLPYWLYQVLVPLSVAETVQQVGVIGYDISRFRRDAEAQALWLRSNLWLDQVKQDYLARRKDHPVNRDHLSSREEQVLKMVVRGLANKTIAVQLNLSARTVEIHRAHLMHKLGIKSTAGLVKYALDQGYFSG